jgi:8-oxo-(d)GTP phosphatase
MNLFIHHTHLKLASSQEIEAERQYDSYLDLASHSLNYTRMKGKVFVQGANLKQLQEIISWAIAHKLPPIDYLHLHFENLEEIKEGIKKSFRVIQAGGGLVKKEDKLLMIYRLGRWDLPKGKMDKDEKFKETARREVEEECNIKVKVDSKICTTWHYYTTGKFQNLKQTRWYEMTCLDDRYMKPQVEEDILDIKWMREPEWREALVNSYQAIRFVFDSYSSLLADRQAE